MPSPYYPSSHAISPMVGSHAPGSAPSSPQQSPTAGRQHLPPPPPVRTMTRPVPPVAPPSLDSRRGSVMPPPIPLRITSLPTPPAIPPALLQRQNSLGSMYSAYLRQHGLMADAVAPPPVPMAVVNTYNSGMTTRPAPSPITTTTTTRPPPVPAMMVPSSPFSPTLVSPAQSPASAGGSFFPSSTTVRDASVSVDSAIVDSRRPSVVPPPLPSTLSSIPANTGSRLELKRTRPPPIQASASLPIGVQGPVLPSQSPLMSIKEQREEKINPVAASQLPLVVSPSHSHSHTLAIHPPTSDQKCERLDPTAFASHLHHRPDIVSSQCTAGLSTAKRVRSFLHSYALLQQRHANEIEKLIHYEVGKLGSTLNDDRQHAFNMVYQNLLMKIGMEGVTVSTLSNDISSQCIESMDRLINASVAMTKQHNDEAKRHQAAMDKAFVSIAKARENARQALAKNDARKALKSCEQYERIIEQSNDIYQQHQVAELPKLLSEMQGLEEMRLNTLAATLKTFASLTLHQAHSVKQLHHDIKALTESFNVNHDLKLFVAEAIQEHGPPLPMQPFAYDITVTTSELRAEIERETQAAKNNTSITLSAQSQSAAPPSLFFDSLERVMEYERTVLKLPADANTNSMPTILSTLISAIRQHGGLDAEGIFRLSVSSDELHSLRKRMESGDYSVDASNPHLYAALLKAWLRDLSEPVIPFALYDQCIEIGKSDVQALFTSEDGRQSLSGTLSSMPPLNARVLVYLLDFLTELSSLPHVEHNRMTTQNLAIVFAPGLIRSEASDPVIMLRDSKYACNAVAAFIELTRSKNTGASVCGSADGAGARKASVASPPPIPTVYHSQRPVTPTLPRLERSQSANSDTDANASDDSQRVFIHGLQRAPSESSSANHGHSASSHVSQLDPLPPHWNTSFDPSSGQSYYWHSVTRDTSWERPTH